MPKLQYIKDYLLNAKIRETLSKVANDVDSLIPQSEAEFDDVQKFGLYPAEHCQPFVTRQGTPFYQLDNMSLVPKNDTANYLKYGDFEFRQLEILYNMARMVLGVEAAAIMKNVYALAVGIAVGLRYGDNFLAVLISGCANEMNNFLAASVPIENRNINAAAYMGDLLVTCYSPLSRNRRLGTLLGKGCSVKSALNEMTMVAEGYYAAECIRRSSMRSNVEMPIADMVWEVLYNNASARDAMLALTKILK